MPDISITESPSFFDDLEKMSVRELLENINKEDQTVYSAVKEVIPQIELLVNQTIVRMRKGGRLFLSLIHI